MTLRFNQQQELAMSFYSAIDLHANNHVLTIIDDQDKRVFEQRLDNGLEQH